MLKRAAVYLFPVALVAGFVLLIRTEPKPPIQATLDRPSAIRLARDYAIRQGIPAGNWNYALKNDTDKNLLNFVNAKPERTALWRVAPPLTTSVKLREPGGKQAVRVNISLDGLVTGYEWTNAPVSTATLSDADALALAATRVPPNFQFGSPTIERKGGARIYTYASPAVPDVDLKAHVTVTGNRVTAWSTSAGTGGSSHDSAGDAVRGILAVTGFLFVCVVVIFSIYRYASRTVQQEISHRRSLVVAVLCGVFCMLIAENAGMNTDGGDVPFVALLAIFGVLGLVAGALLAAAYGSGEGDIREAYPGKLTALDALLTGRLFSRNLGLSVITGMAIAGWLLLFFALLVVPFRSQAVRGSESMNWGLVRFGEAMSLITWPLLALSLTAAALLQPLAFLHRYAGRIRRWHLPLLVLAGALVVSLRTHTASNLEFFVFTGALVTAILLPFFLNDLLATIVCVAAFSAACGLEQSLAATPSRTPSLMGFGLVGLGILLFAILAYRFGRVYSEAEVRPLYAHHIEERKSLEAEVSAAREAQLRLLPQTIPGFNGLGITASCVPAEIVGGDFYDFFHLGDNRLGIFIAEGNNRGLAAALTIALAKGYLMHCTGRYREPADVLVRLETALASIFGDSGSALTDFAFASVDVARGELRYARTGAYPKVVLSSRSGAAPAERLVPVKGRPSPIAEGFAALAPGDHILLFTDGIGRRLAAGGARNVEEAAENLAARDEAGAEAVRDRFLAAGRGSTEPDDLTVVVVQVQAVGASAFQVVA